MDVWISTLVPALRLVRNNLCCGVFELNIGPTNAVVAANLLKTYQAELKVMSNNAPCSGMPGYATAGIKGAGLILINVLVPKEGDPAGTDDQTKFEPLFKELGFRRVKTYMNPRTGRWLRMYYTTGEELRKALNP